MSNDAFLFILFTIIKLVVTKGIHVNIGNMVPLLIVTNNGTGSSDGSNNKDESDAFWIQLAGHKTNTVYSFLTTVTTKFLFSITRNVNEHFK